MSVGPPGRHTGESGKRYMGSRLPGWSEQSSVESCGVFVSCGKLGVSMTGKFGIGGEDHGRAADDSRAFPGPHERGCR